MSKKQMRPLNEDEKRLTERNVKNQKEILYIQEQRMKEIELKLDGLLHANYLENLRQYNKQKKIVSIDIDIAKELIKVSEEQIKNGVQFKEIKDEKEKSDEDLKEDK